MAKKQIEVEPEREIPTDAFVERGGESAPSRPRRITLRIAESGNIDWENTSDKQKQAFAEIVSQDPDALEMIGLASGGDSPADPLAVTPEHVGMFLDLFAVAETYMIPLVIAKQSKGIIRITKEQASAVYSFTPEQKKTLGGPGAEWANQNFPEWLRKFLLEMGPGAQFFGGLAMISYAQTKQLIENWKESHDFHKSSETQPINGKDAEAK